MKKRYGIKKAAVILSCVLLAAVVCAAGPLSQPVSAMQVLGSSVPNTGDNSDILLWAALLAAAFIGLLILLIVFLVKRRKNASKNRGRHYK